MIIFHMLVLLLFLVPSCKSLDKHGMQSQENEDAIIIDLTASTNIIMKLIQEDALAKVLEDQASQDGITLLIRNFSPSEMAFEAEVLNYRDPVVVIFFKDNQQWDALSNLFMNMADIYKSTSKWVRINAEELFRIAEHSEVDSLPSIVVIHNRQEIARYEQCLSNDVHQIEKFLQSTLDSLVKQT